MLEQIFLPRKDTDGTQKRVNKTPKSWHRQSWEDEGQRELLQNHANTSKDSLLDSHKVKYNLSIWVSSCAPVYPNDSKTEIRFTKPICPSRNLHMNVYSSCLDNRRKPESTSMLSRWRMDIYDVPRKHGRSIMWDSSQQSKGTQEHGQISKAFC